MRPEPGPEPIGGHNRSRLEDISSYSNSEPRLSLHQRLGFDVRADVDAERSAAVEQGSIEGFTLYAYCGPLRRPESSFRGLSANGEAQSRELGGGLLQCRPDAKVLELGDTAGEEPLAAGFAPGEASPVYEQDLAAKSTQMDGSSGAGDTPADDEDIVHAPRLALVVVRRFSYGDHVVV